MSYTKQTWQNNSSKLNESRMSHIEDGIYDNSIAIDSMIESSSNEYGYYTKYSDGTLICTGKLTSITTQGYAGTSTLVTLPHTFINTNYCVSASIENGQAYWAGIGMAISNKTTSSFNLDTWNNGAYANEGQNYSYIAIGRWK